jgi:hypothetical protein
MSTAEYNNSYNYILRHFQMLASAAEDVNVTIEEQIGSINENRLTPIMQYQTDVRNILVTIDHGQSSPPLMLSAHLDSKNTGPGAYDDAAGIATLLELGETVIEGSVPPPAPVLLLFIGTEELGIQGSSLFLQNPRNITAFLNIDSLGTGPPVIFSQKGKTSSSTIWALALRPGSIIITVPNDALKIGAFDTLSDASRFGESGLAGGEILFMGNPGHYHTRRDRIGPAEDLQLIGDHAAAFVYNYPISSMDVDLIACGISPLIAMIPARFSSFFLNSLRILSIPFLMRDLAATIRALWSVLAAFCCKFVGFFCLGILYVL